MESSFSLLLDGIYLYLTFAIAIVVVSVIAIWWKKYASRANHFENKQQIDDYNEDHIPLLAINNSDNFSIRSSSIQGVQNINWSNVLTVFINGNKIELVNPDPSELLSNFIRNKIGLKGTKLGCEEGGCGACSIVLTKKEGVVSVNSCLRPLCANDGMAITTIEGVGSVKSGLSSEQKAIVANNGTQCGFCTPGWVNNMHALNTATSDEGKSFSKMELENYLDGNICRCTGYKPIATAFGTFADQAPQSHCQSASNNSHCDNHNKSDSCEGLCGGNSSNCSTINDLEDMLENCSSKASVSSCSSHNKAESNKLLIASRKRDKLLVNSYTPLPLMFYNPVTNKRWIRPVGLDQLCIVLKAYETETVQLVGGNTSIGVSKYLNDSAPYNTADEYSVFVDINAVPEFIDQSFDTETGELVVGAATTINGLVSVLRKFYAISNAKEMKDHAEVDNNSVFSVTAHHLSLIANTQVRNAGSWAGNLMLFMKYKEFPSDAVLALTTANARLKVANSFGIIRTMRMEEFITYNSDSFHSEGLMIISLAISEPVINKQHQHIEFVSETFKIAQRNRNAHAWVNAGFSFQIVRPFSLVGNHNPRVLSARIVYGGVSKQTFIAHRTEHTLTNNVLSTELLQFALSQLNDDLNEVGISTAYGNQKFRENVMQTCLYRALLKCYPTVEIPSPLLSAVQPWTKPLSRGTEIFLPSLPKDKESPVGKPIRKVEAPIQATGEAVYPSDVPLPPQGLHGAIVYSTKCCAILNSFDFTQALSLPGVVAVYSANDVTGENSISASIPLFVPIGEEVKCIGAPLAVVIATSEKIANDAAGLVRVVYQDTGIAPIPNLDEAIKRNSFYDVHIPQVTFLTIGNPSQAMKSAPNRVKGHITAGGQYHFYMEAQTAIASVIDGDNIEITCGTQDAATTQSQLAALLGLPQNKININCPRTGGGFGGKLTGNLTVTAAAALSAVKLGRPVRIFNTRTADMLMQGGRECWSVDYEVGFDNNGQILALDYDIYVDAGMAKDDTIGSVFMGMTWADNTYFIPNYIAKAKLCYTNTPSRTYMRAPGVVQSCFATEVVIERVAAALNLPTVTVQQLNFIKNGDLTILGQPMTNCTLDTVWSTLLQRSKYNERMNLVNKYNSSNLWRKKGLSICPVKYGMGWGGFNAGVRIGVRSSDGTVTVSHNGIELGQGINTKVIQTVAMCLGIDYTLIKCTTASTDRIINGGNTGGSGTSEVVCQAAINACKTLNDRLEPYRKTKTTKPADWVKLLSSVPCDVSLNVEGWYSPVTNPNNQPFQYFVYAACVTEIELDVLSGNVHILSSEIVYDCGLSLNPAVDIGQIEGAFVMGLGYFLTERVEYDSLGQLLTNGTWEYKVPMLQDIPNVMNVTLLKNSYNKDGVLGSKAVGEPPYVIANSIYFAMKMAIQSARYDAGIFDYFEMDVPATVDLRQQACLVNSGRFVMP
eukprot:gene4721-6626_t